MSKMDLPGIRAIADWLIDGARSAPTSEAVMEELCRWVVACGLPLWRAAVFIRTPHPQFMGRRFIWRPQTGVEASAAPFETLDSQEYLNSPVVRVYATGAPLRRRLADPDCPMDFATLHELRAEGATDYLIEPLIFTDGAIHAASWTTRQAGGFTEADLAAIETVVRPLARVAEIRALRRTAANLLDTYVGRQAGERIWAGQIRRGQTEAIHAAIWLSDMRGFTSLADRLPPQDLTDLLNRYFDCQVPAILEHGGEVLKFIGDGLLAIFPVVSTGADAGKTCRAALTAALAAKAEVAAIAGAADISSAAGLRFGLALHIGDVLYGNIGSGNRLDFTCIGPAVNLAARLEKLAAKQGREIIASGAFAGHCGEDLARLGEFELPGFVQAQEAFGLRE